MCASDVHQLQVIAGIVVRMDRVTLLQKRQTGSGSEETDFFETVANRSYMKVGWLHPIALKQLKTAAQSGHHHGRTSRKSVQVEVSRKQLELINNTHPNAEKQYLAINCSFLTCRDAAFSRLEFKLAQIVVRAPSQEDFPSI